MNAAILQYLPEMKMVFRVLVFLVIFSSCQKEEDTIHVATPAVQQQGTYVAVQGNIYNGDTIVFTSNGMSYLDSAAGVLEIHLIDGASSSPHYLELYTRKRIAGYDILGNYTAAFENRFYDGRNFLADGVVLHIIYCGPPGSVVNGTYAGRMIDPTSSDTIQVSGAFEVPRLY